MIQRLFKVNTDTHLAEPHPEMRNVKHFRKLITRDRGSPGDSQGRKKKRASQEFAYIYFMEDPRSPYMDVHEDQREETVIKHVFGDDTDWSPDELVQEARQTYAEMVETTAVQLLKSSKRAVHKLREFFDTVDLTKLDDNDKPIYKARDLISNLNEIGDVVDGLEALEERVAKQQQQDAETRGDVEITEFQE